jgi:hypothetical protein
MRKRYTLLTACLIVFLSLLLAGCASQASITRPIQAEPTTASEFSQSQFIPLIRKNVPTAEPNSMAPNPAETATLEEPPPSDAQGQSLPPERWQEWPVIPVISDYALEIYRAGIAQGNDPMHFSKVGDCQNIRQYFLGLFDESGTYRLGDNYAYLQETIDHYAGNWSRDSEAVRTGFNVASVLAALQANPENCQPSETPLACEIRIWNPSFVLISMETWNADRPVQDYENYLRQIVDYAISENVMPIVGTKADNLEGNDAINQSVARIAAEYDIPLWNFWAATQPLTDQGLYEDRFHLTNGPNYYDDPVSLDLAWPVRNLTGLLTIDAVWKAAR